LRVEEESSPHVTAVRQPSLFHVRIAVVAIVVAILARTPAIPGAPHTIAIAYADARAAIEAVQVRAVKVRPTIVSALQVRDLKHRPGTDRR
jgi:hypothetical protein